MTNSTDDYDKLPEAVWYEPEPYYGCPVCEAHDYGAEDPFAKPLVYRCHECGTRFRGVVGVHHGPALDS